MSCLTIRSVWQEVELPCFAQLPTLFLLQMTRKRQTASLLKGSARKWLQLKPARSLMH